MVQWHCRNNNAAGIGLARASLVFTRERTPPPGEAPPPPERLQVWQEECLPSSLAQQQHQQGRQRLQQAKVPAERVVAGFQAAPATAECSGYTHIFA
jgi:hypothetical protein